MSVLYVYSIHTVCFPNIRQTFQSKSIHSKSIPEIVKFGGHTEPQKIEFFKQPWKDDFGFEVAR